MEAELGIFHNITEGGQTWAHRFRMLRQVIKTTSFISLGISAVIFVALMLQLDFVLYEAAWYYVKADSFAFNPQIEVDSNIWSHISHENRPSTILKLPPETILKHTYPYTKLLLNNTIAILKLSGWWFISAFAITIGYFLIRGYFAKRKKHVSGRRMAPVWYLALKLRLKCKNSDIKIGPLPLLRGTETQHIMVTGGTGSGKTNCFHHILPHIRRNEQKAIVVDTTGAFIQRYYRPGLDILLNPFDSNGADWHPWAECRNRFDIDEIAECFIPSTYSEHENYWRTAARTVFCSLMQKCETEKRTSDLTRWILFEPLTHLCSYIRGTKGAAHMDMNSEKTAASIRSVTSSFLSCLEFLNDTESPFSIRDWMQNQHNDSWLFLSCTTAQRASIRPLISCWFSIATRNLIQLSPDIKRRIWFIVDELPTLNKLKDLEIFLAESRKYGGCALLALQSIAQLDAIYGKEITKTIIGNCATKIAFSEQDPEIASRISKAFGEREIKEYQEGISYGAHETRDGVNLSLQGKTQPLVSVTEIQSLKRNQAFVKLPESYPITKIKLSIQKSNP